MPLQSFRPALILALTAFAVFATLPARADKILIVGDSISCGPFGANVIAGLTEQGHSVKMYCEVGSAPANWVKGHNANAKWPCQTRTYSASKVSSRAKAPHAEAVVSASCDGSNEVPSLSEILKRNPSDRVIVALGTNSLPSKPDVNYNEMIQQIASARRACVWIGPPHLQPSKAFAIAKTNKEAARKNISVREAGLNDFYDSLNSKLEGLAQKKASCKLLDSRDATAPGTPGNETGEGIHATAAAARYRYEEMSRAITNAASASTTGTSTGRPSIK